MGQKVLKESIGNAERKFTVGEEKGKERFETLLEEIRDKISTVAEGHEIIRREMREMGTGLMSEIGDVKSAVKSVAVKLDAHLKVPHACLPARQAV